MSIHDTPITKVVRRDTSTHTRLRGGWLWAARIGWTLLMLIGLGLFTAVIPIRIRELSVACAKLPCAQLQASPAGEAVLQELGIPLTTYAFTIAALDVSLAVIFAGSGVIIFWRRSDDRLALMFSAMLIQFGLFTHPDVLPLLSKLPMVYKAVAAAAISPQILFTFVFPDGRFVPRWAGWIALALVLGTIVTGVTGDLYNLTMLTIFAIGTGIGLASQVYRYQAVSGPVERQQTKWVVFGIAGVFVALVFLLLPPALLPEVISAYDKPLSTLYDFIYRVPYGFIFGFIPLYALPVTIAISVLRYRLWDVDPIINRSLVYGGMVVLLLGFFGLSLFVISRLFQNFAGGPLVALVVAAGAFGAVFNPARKWLRHFVDSRLYGIKIDYQKADTPVTGPVAASRTLRTSAGVYENLEPIGRGGMAEIYKAMHPTLGKPVAIKILPEHLAKEPDFRKRFEREARVVSDLKHPNIVQMFDFGETDGTHYMVMEFVDGRDLGDVIESDRRLPFDRAKAILADIASALDYAHAQGLVHRDIKPSNVMIESNRAVLMDFGIARILTGGTRLTVTGTMGTFDYISPEQIQAAANVDGRADVYSLGVVAYQMLTGRLPFESGHPAACLIAHLNQPAPDPRERVPDLPEGAASAVMTAMAKKPDQRFNTAGEFIAAMTTSGHLQ